MPVTKIQKQIGHYLFPSGLNIIKIQLIYSFPFMIANKIISGFKYAT